MDNTPDAMFDSLRSLHKEVEENFVDMGELLSGIRRTKLFRLKGYNTFKAFVETEYGIGGGLANKLAAIYELFVEDMDKDGESVQSIGLEKLSLIKPLAGKNASWEEKEGWFTKAEELPVPELREEVKQYKAENQDELDVKQVFAEQNKERMVTLLNCGTKELDFKYALFFQKIDDDGIKTVIKNRQREFEEALNNPSSQKEQS